MTHSGGGNAAVGVMDYLRIERKQNERELLDTGRDQLTKRRNNLNKSENLHASILLLLLHVRYIRPECGLVIRNDLRWRRQQHRDGTSRFSGTARESLL